MTLSEVITIKDDNNQLPTYKNRSTLKFEQEALLETEEELLNDPFILDIVNQFSKTDQKMLHV